MDRNNIITIAAVVLLVGAVLFSFDSETTGRAVNAQDVVVVSPQVVRAGEFITIEVLPSAKGVNNEVKIFDSSDLRKAQLKIRCSSFRCSSSASSSQKTGSNWDPGVYYVKYYDYNTAQFAKAYFTIE